MVVVRSNSEKLRSELIRLRSEGKQIGLVPTMGSLHEGHLSLIREARVHGSFPVVSIYINPTQFGPNEDLDSYPRNEKLDIELAKNAGAGLVWIPSMNEIYPYGTGTRAQQIEVVPGSIAQRLCGASRPVFFTGICTVVLKLFNIIKPDSAYFGEKDFQQLQIIRRMVKELHLDIDIVGCPIIREKDGLAMSSRNLKIPSNQRETARHLFQTIQKAQILFQKRERDPLKMEQSLQDKWPVDLECDYLEFRDPVNLEPVKTLKANTRLFLGAWLNSPDQSMGARGVRLIDNAALSDI